MNKEFVELEKRAKAYKWGSYEKKDWSDWGLLFRFLILICKLLNTNFLIKKETKTRKVSKWSKFLGSYLAQGKTTQEASVDWKKRKS